MLIEIILKTTLNFLRNWMSIYFFVKFCCVVCFNERFLFIVINHFVTKKTIFSKIWLSIFNIFFKIFTSNYFEFFFHLLTTNIFIKVMVNNMRFNKQNNEKQPK